MAPRKQAKKDVAVSATVAWLANVLTSVAIVFANKTLMGRYQFRQPTLLTALHFAVCSVAVKALQRSSDSSGSTNTPRKLPLRDLVIFTLVANISIVSLNLSLLLNSVSFYQVAKLLIIPCVCAVEYIILGTRLSAKTMASILLVAIGVAIVTVEDLQFSTSLIGASLAALSIVSSCSQQVMVRALQKAHRLTPQELLANVAPTQAVTLFILGPFIDKAITNTSFTTYQWTYPAALALFISCSLAVGVNISQFMCLGNVSAVSFQVLGHTKTVLVLLGSWLVLGEIMTIRKLVGMVLAVTGMILYSQLQQQASDTTKKSSQGRVTRSRSNSRNTTPVLAGGGGLDVERPAGGVKHRSPATRSLQHVVVNSID